MIQTSIFSHSNSFNKGATSSTNIRKTARENNRKYTQAVDTSFST